MGGLNQLIGHQRRVELLENEARWEQLDEELHRPHVGKGERQQKVEIAIREADQHYKTRYMAAKGLARISYKLPINWSRSLFNILRRHNSKLFYDIVKQSLSIVSRKPLVNRFAM